MKRHSSSYAGNKVPLASSLGRRAVFIHNPYPDIAEPLTRPYYLPIIDSLYFPTPDGSSLFQSGRLLDAFVHEYNEHYMLANSTSTCELRALVFTFTIKFWDILFQASTTGYRISLPSFEVVDSHGNTITTELVNLAQQIDDILYATSIIQEIAAYLAVESPDKTTVLIQEYLDTLEGESAALFRQWCSVYLYVAAHSEYIPLGQIAHYTLNTTGLTVPIALRRFINAFKAAYGFNEPQPHNPVGNITWRRKFTRYIGQTLPDAMSPFYYCPIVGSCLPLVVEAGTLSRSDYVSRIIQSSVTLMNYLRCGRIADFRRYGYGYVGHLEEAILRAAAPNEAEEALTTTNVQRRYQSPLAIFYLKPSQQEGRSIITATISKPAAPITKIDDIDLFGTLMFEAFRQQVWTGNGPHCIEHFDDSNVNSCDYTPFVSLLWKYTINDHEADLDPTWRWKKKPIGCVR